jgi:hypothetical protein
VTLASAAWKNAVRVRSSHPLAASCGNSRMGSGPPEAPAAIIAIPTKATSPANRIDCVVDSDSGSGSRWIHQKLPRPNTK